MARSGFRFYNNIKNFAEHKCVKVKHGFDEYWGRTDCPEEYWEENVHEDIGSWCTGKYTWNNKFLYFEKDMDAMLFTLRYPVK